MKKRLFLSTAGLLFVYVALIAQSVPVEIISAFKKGNSDELRRYFSDNVELIILDKQSNEGHLAESNIKGFFSNHKVNDFVVNHQGKRDDSGFMIGTLSTMQGCYRVNCYLRKERNEYLIHQIRIDKIND